MAPARRGSRGSRDSGRSASVRGSGRTSARSGGSKRGDRGKDDSRSSSRSSSRTSSRSGGSRRGDRDDRDEDGRSSGRESGRGGGPSKDTTYIIAGVVGAVVVLGLGLLLLSGKKKRVVRREKRAPVATQTRVATMDFYSEGMSRGYDWKSRMKNRQTPFTEEEVREVADRMKWDYTKQGVEGPGEQRFVDGFVKAVLGK